MIRRPSRFTTPKFDPRGWLDYDPHPHRNRHVEYRVLVTGAFKRCLCCAASGTRRWGRLPGVGAVIRRFGELAGFALLVTVLVVVPVASTMADTSAASYHWARKRSQFTLKVGDNVSGDWNTYLRRAISDWNKNDTVTLDKVGGGTRLQGLQSNEGQVEVCNWPYGTQKGWLGLTRLYFNNQGDHIEAVTVQLNDSFLYAPNSRYNNNAARRHTICHELGHSIGLWKVMTITDPV